MIPHVLEPLKTLKYQENLSNTLGFLNITTFKINEKLRKPEENYWFSIEKFEKIKKIEKMKILVSKIQPDRQPSSQPLSHPVSQPELAAASQPTSQPAGQWPQQYDLDATKKYDLYDPKKALSICHPKYNLYEPNNMI